MQKTFIRVLAILSVFVSNERLQINAFTASEEGNQLIYAFNIIFLPKNSCFKTTSCAMKKLKTHVGQVQMITRM
jgi:hypothetical protein